MLKYRLGCAASTVRFILVLLNVIFFILGIVIFVSAAVLKWSNFFQNILKIPNVDTVLKIGTLQTVNTLLLVLGGFCILVSLFGLIGVKYMNRFFLIIYEIIMVVLFLAHGIGLLVLIFQTSSAEKILRDGLNSTISDINNKKDTGAKKCNLMNDISTLFKCCGANGKQDFVVNGTLCCNEKYVNNDGCANKFVAFIKSNAFKLLIIPSLVILGIELFVILMVPCLLSRKSESGSDRYITTYNNY